MWTTITDTEGNRWLVNPKGERVASIFDEATADRLLVALTPKAFAREIDLTRGTKSDHPDLNAESQYLVKVYENWHFGRFTRQHYGWNFTGWGSSGCQFNTPGYNHSSWERIIEIDPEMIPIGPKVGWESSAEWELETAMFQAAGDPDVPESARKLIGRLWKEYCLAAEPKSEATNG